MSLYACSVPVFIRALQNLAAELRKAETHIQAQGGQADSLLHAALAPDMFNLIRQVQSASDTAKGAGARLAGVTVPSYADTETTFAALQERIAKTVAFLESLSEEGFGAVAEVTVPLKSGSLTFAPMQYLTVFALPNFFFHAVTAYDVMRAQGIPLGKLDFLGSLDFARK